MLPSGQFRALSYAIYGGNGKPPGTVRVTLGWRTRNSGEFRPVIRLPSPRQETLSLGVLTQPIGAYENLEAMSNATYPRRG